MPRYSLKRSPWYSTTSPGASSVPASIEPVMTVGAGRDRLGDVAGANAAVGDDGELADRLAARVVDRGHLRDADAGDDARRAG